MKKILIIDDDDSILRLVTEILKNSGYKSQTANDAYQGLKLEKEVKPDLILLDLQMPAGGGMHTYENLKKSIYTSEIPIIIFTAVNRDEIEELVLQMGADAFIQKPFSKNEMIEKIKYFIG